MYVLLTRIYNIGKHWIYIVCVSLYETSMASSGFDFFPFSPQSYAYESNLSFSAVYGSLICCTVASLSHLDCYHVNVFRASFIFRRRNFHMVMILDGCDRLFSLQYFRTLPVGYILGCILVCVPSIFVFIFSISTASLPPKACITCSF